MKPIHLILAHLTLCVGTVGKGPFITLIRFTVSYMSLCYLLFTPLKCYSLVSGGVLLALTLRSP